MSIWDICWSSNAFRLVQCLSNVSTLHVESFFWYGRTILRYLHGWFLHLRRLIFLKSSPFGTHLPMLRWEKSDIGLGEMSLHGKTWNYLGSWNLYERIEVDKAKIEVITKLPMPKCVKDIRSFLGHAGFYRRFIKDFSKIARPLTNLLAKDVSFTFDAECMNSWEKLKRELISAPIISTPDWSNPFEIMCDASDFAIGAVLGQHIDNK